MATPTPQENDFLVQSTHDDLESQDKGCRGCIRSLSFFSSQRHHHVATNDVDRVHLLPQRLVESESWVVRQVKKLREVSELVAGPKWKNFLRKIGSYFGNNNKRKGIQYNSFDYTLNFDDGNHDHDHDGGVSYGFTSRFAPPVVQHDNNKGRSST